MFPESAGAPRGGRNSGSRASSTSAVHKIRRAQRNTGRFRGSRTVCAASRSGPESSRRGGGRGQDDMVLKQGHVCGVQVYEFLMINGAQRATEADASQRRLIGSAAEGLASRIPHGARWGEAEADMVERRAGRTPPALESAVRSWKATTSRRGHRACQP